MSVAILFRCLDCGHAFDETQMGHDYDRWLNKYECCPACGCEDLDEQPDAFPTIPRVAMPVQVSSFDDLARKALDRMVEA